jgi:hypothetical protein
VLESLAVGALSLFAGAVTAGLPGMGEVLGFGGSVRAPRVPQAASSEVSSRIDSKWCRMALSKNGKW